MLELVRRIQNTVVFTENLFRTATHLVESILFRREFLAFSDGKVGHFKSLHLYHEPLDKSNFRFFSMRPQILKSNPTYPSASGCVTRKLLQTYPGAQSTYFGRVRKFCTTSSRKSFVRNGKQWYCSFLFPTSNES